MLFKGCDKMTRITMTMTTSEAIKVMSENNPGCMRFLVETLKLASQVDPDSALGAIGPMMLLDMLGLYGSEAYLLWNDICKQDTAKTIGLLRANQLGFISGTELKKQVALEHQNTLDVDSLIAQVKERLPDFNVRVKFDHATREVTT